MKIVVAPDSFKETLSAAQVAQAIAAGLRQARSDLEIDLCPMADGGQGTVAAMVAAMGGRLLSVPVVDALSRPRQAKFGLIERSDRKIAIIEMAQAAGLELLAPAHRNPLLTTTFGVGQLILAALDAGAEEIILGIGGSATNDGGVGCAQALGVVFLDAQSKVIPCGAGGGQLDRIGGIDVQGRDERIGRVPIRVACDVTNLLTGPKGAAAVFGPQKGATPEMVAQLDAGLANLAAVIRRDLGLEVENLSGAGAAGGLGAGLVAFAQARLERGVQIVAEAVGLARRLAGADLVITGEGRLDEQSSAGKTAAGVAKLGRRLGVPAVCICGQCSPAAPRELFRAVYPLVGPDVTLQDALARPAEYIQIRARQALTDAQKV
jgi:glycerate kinase